MSQIHSSLILSSIVLIVEKPNPGLFTRDYLESKGIFADFEIARATTIPPLSQIVFKNGYVFEAVDNRVKLEISYPNPIQEETINDLLSKAAEILVNDIDHMRFTAVGINFVFVLEGVTNLQSFASPIPKESTVTSVSFKRNQDEFEVNQILALAQNQNTKRIVVQGEVNFHWDVPSNSEREKRIGLIRGAITQRPEFFKKAKELIYAISF
jgi:hypothetical protein